MKQHITEVDASAHRLALFAIADYPVLKEFAPCSVRTCLRTALQGS